MPETVDIEEVRADWAVRGFGCEVWVDPPGQRWEDFVHASDELLVIVEGELEIVVDGVTSRPSVGEELFIPRGATHSVRNVGGTNARWLFGYNGDEPEEE